MIISDLFRQKTNIKKAFSLTENLTVLFVMGLIIGITIPNMMKQKAIKNNRIAVRKAVTTYHNILRKTMIEATGVRTISDLNSILKGNNNDCEKLRSYFALETYNTSKPCQFITQDGVRWNATNPDKVIIGLKNKSLTGNKVYNDLIDTNAKDSANLKVFYIPYKIIGRDIQMLASDDNNLNNAITKTRNFIMGE